MLPNFLTYVVGKIRDRRLRIANSKMKCISWKAWHRKAYQLKSDVYNNKSGQTNELLSS
jgi:hypothetical protein